MAKRAPHRKKHRAATAPYHDETGDTKIRCERRRFLGQLGLSAMSAAIGSTIVFGEYLPPGIIPIALAESPSPPALLGKDPRLTLLNDRPINVETPAYLLDDDITPAGRLFVRNNGHPPATSDSKSWTVRIDGESAQRSLTLKLDALKTRFSQVTETSVLECAGNGRREFFPAAKGNQWSTGAVGCVTWTGVRLRDVLKHVGIKSSAVYVAYEGADTHLSRDPNKKPISRGIPIQKALDDHCMLAWAMNGQPIPPLHGAPLRLVAPGYPGSCAGKWVERLRIRDRVHDGPKMNGLAYRVPCEPVAPGTRVPNDKMCIIEAMPTKSLITFPRSGVQHRLPAPLRFRGHAWSGQATIESVEFSIDFGQSWHRASVRHHQDRYAWHRWSGEVRLPKQGYYELWARARDSSGRTQPMILPGWNPKGYLNNACHRVAIQAIV
ncbi:MAG: sulfite oxidase [Myxococcota bacterium]|nr:sulfite oxidase [Myxococcota bacterium]